MAVRGNYLVATLHWWASNMEIEKKKKKKKRKEKPKIIANRIAMLPLYFQKSSCDFLLCQLLLKQLCQ